MTKVGKILVVLLVFACLAFMGFAAVVAVGGPNWNAEALALEDYAFTPNVSVDGTTWTVTTKIGGENVASNLESLAAAVVRALAHQQQKQREDLEQLNAQIPALEARLQQAKALIEADVPAMEKREAQLSTVLDEQQKQIDDLTNESIKTAEQANQVWAENERRREDIARLQTQLEGIRTDAFHLAELRTHLEDLVIRTQGVLDRLKRRRAQLEASGAVPKTPYVPEEQPATGG